MTYTENNEQNNNKTNYRTLIKQEACRLSELLLESSEYRQFIKARDDLEADDEQCNKFTELRQRQMAMSMAAMSGDEDCIAAADDMNDYYIAVTNNKLINNYLFAEGRLFRLIAEVEDVFNSKLDLWQTQGDAVPDPIASTLN